MSTEPIKTEAIIYSDGYGGIAALNVTRTHKDVIRLMREESTWEVFDDASKLPVGIYRVTFEFWWEMQTPLYDNELVIGYDGMSYEIMNRKGEFEPAKDLKK